MGGQLSHSQRQFVILQSKKNILVSVGKKRKRTSEKDTQLKKLQIQIKNGKRGMEDFDERLLIKLPGKSGAERKAKMRADQDRIMDKSGAQRQAKRKESRTMEQVKKENCDERVRLVAKRAGGLTEARLEDVRAGRKKNKDTSIYSGDALKTKEITEGSFMVEALTGGSDSLGALGDFSCSHCGALRFCQICFQCHNQIYLLFAKLFVRWKHETSPSMCCQGGTVTVPAYPPPPPELMRLWFDDTAEAKLFRQHARSVNNATSLSSFVVNERRQDHGTSSVVMQGKLTQLIGSLQPPDGSRPVFAQLYTVDPETEASTREGSFYLPDSLSRPQKAALTTLMWRVVAVLRRENSLVADFRMACETFEQQQVKDGRVVISTSARPADGHERTYNLQVVSFNIVWMTKYINKEKLLFVVQNKKMHNL